MPLTHYLIKLYHAKNYMQMDIFSTHLGVATYNKLLIQDIQCKVRFFIFLLFFWEASLVEEASSIDNEGVLNIPLSSRSRIIRCSLVSYPGHMLVGGYPSADMQSTMPIYIYICIYKYSCYSQGN